MKLLIKLLVLCSVGLLLSSCGGSKDTWDAAGVGSNGTPDFTIQITPSSQEIDADDTGSFTVTVTSVNGYSSPVQLSGSGIPGTQTDYTFGPTTVTPTAQGATSTLSLYVDYRDTDGDYQLTVTGTGPSTTHSATATVTVANSG